MIEQQFICRALADPSTVWRLSDLRELATMAPPERVFGRRYDLLRGDIAELWSTWFLESLADPRRIANDGIRYPRLFSQVLESVDARFSTADTTAPERRALAAAAARILFRIAQTIAASRQRRPLTFDERRALLSSAGNPPRCWICGAEFGEVEVDNFQYGKRQAVPLPNFVDILKPRGLREDEVRIEADHIFPLAKGGMTEGNLALACGWCNRQKGARLSTFDTEGQPRSAGPNPFGFGSVPQPFWIVRSLALVGVCEHGHGCDQSVLCSELTIAPIAAGGAFNPTNLRVVCYAHDPLGVERLQPPSVVRKLWNCA